MKVVRAALIGIAPSLIGIVGSIFFPTVVGNTLMSVVYVLSVACCFWGGFGIADQCVRSPGKNLALGFSLATLFLVINFGAPLAMASKRSKEHSEERREILETGQRMGTERGQLQ
jgi:hypothetical protein